MCPFLQLRAYPSDITIYECNDYSHKQIEKMLFARLCQDSDLEDSEDTNKVCKNEGAREIKKSLQYHEGNLRGLRNKKK